MKFKKGKKVLSLVLAALMVLSVMPTSMLIQKANAATAFEGGKEVADGTWKGWTWSVFGNSTAVANNTYAAPSIAAAINDIIITTAIIPISPVFGDEPSAAGFSASGAAG